MRCVKNRFHSSVKVKMIDLHVKPFGKERVKEIYSIRYPSILYVTNLRVVVDFRKHGYLATFKTIVVVYKILCLVYLNVMF